MGIGATDDGLSIQFCNKDGSPNGAPLYGRYAAMYGAAQVKVIAAGAAANSDEMKFKGSADWLTLIVVADSQDKLDKILKETSVTKTAANTSGSSRRVQIDLHIGEIRQTFKERITIASGPIVDINAPKVDAVHVKILPEGTKIGDLGENNRFFSEFRGNSIVLE